MEEKTFYFDITSDYRCGPQINVYNEEEAEENEDILEDGVVITFNIPKEGLNFYIVNEFPNYEPIWCKNINESDDYRAMYLKIFSLINKCLPFNTTGHTCSGKERGDYPKITKEIKDMTCCVDKKIISNIKKNDDEGCYFVFVINSDGEQIFTKLLLPLN